jgi:hypothetical protein
VKDHDLWQRVDRALLFHQVECQAWQFEEALTSDEQLTCQAAPAGDVAIVPATCGESLSKTCEPSPISTLAEQRLAPTRRGEVPASRVRKRRIGPQNAGLRAGLANAFASQAASLREKLHGLVDPERRLATGAA